MFSANTFFFQYNEAGCIMKSAGQTARFTFEDMPDDRVLQAGDISSFLLFEMQIGQQLKAHGFKRKGFFKKDIICVAIPGYSAPIHKRSLFEAFDRNDFSEVYLIYEHVVLATGLKTRFPDKSIFGIVDIGPGKIDISLVEGTNLTSKSSLQLGKERMDRYLLQTSMKEWLNEAICSDAEEVLNGLKHHPDTPIILTGVRMRTFDLEKPLQALFGAERPFVYIDNPGEHIIAELESIWENQKGGLWNN